MDYKLNYVCLFMHFVVSLICLSPCKQRLGESGKSADSSAHPSPTVKEEPGDITGATGNDTGEEMVS